MQFCSFLHYVINNQLESYIIARVYVFMLQVVWCVCVFGGGDKGKQKCSSYSVTSARMCMNNQLTGRYMKRDYIKRGAPGSSRDGQ